MHGLEIPIFKMYVVKENMEGKIDFDFGSEVGTRTLSNNLPQALLERVYNGPYGSTYVTKKKGADQPVESEAKNG